MGAVVDGIKVLLEGDTKQYESKMDGAARVTEKDMQRIVDAADKAEKGSSGSLTRIAGGFARFAALAGVSVVALAGSMVAGAASIARYVAGLDGAAKKLGVTTDQLQQYRYAADVAGVSSAALDRGMEHLDDVIGKASLGSEKQAKLFKTLGIELQDTAGKFKSAGDQLPILADRLNSIKDPAQRAATAQLFLGEAAQEMEPLLARGSAGIDELADAADRLGIVLSSDQIQRADETAKKLDDVRRVLSAEISSIVVDNADAIITLANSFVTLASNIGGAIQAYSIWSNMQGYRVGDRESIKSLVATKSGRDAILNDTDAKMRQNQRDRASNRGGRKKILGGLVEVTDGATKAENAQLDREYQALSRLRNRILAMDARAGGGPNTPPPGTPPNVSNLLAPAPNKGRSGPSAETLAKRAEAERRRQLRDDVQFAQEQDAIRMDILAAQTDINGTEEDRLNLARARVTAQRVADERGLQLDFERSDVEKQTLATLYREREAIELRAIAEEKRLRDMETATDVSVNALRRDREIVELQARQAATAKERRALELKILDYQYREAEERLKLLMASKDLTTAAEARKDYDNLQLKKGLERDGITRANMSPMEAYLDSIPDTAAEIDAALEGIAVNGLRDIEDGFVDATKKALGLKGAVGDLVGEMIRLVFQRQVLASFGSLFDGKPGATGIFGKIGSILGMGKAGGGPVTGGNYYRVNEASAPGKVEGFVPAGSGQIIPLGRMNAPSGTGASVIQHFHLDARGAVMTQDIVNQINAMGQEAAIAGAQGGHALAQRDLKSLMTPKL